MLPKGYQAAQISLNGHVITRTIKSKDDIKEDFCEKCGKLTITNCQKCDKWIKGEFYNPDVNIIGFNFPPPNFCWSCGQAYPWTKSKIKAIKELIDFENNIREDEKKIMKKNIEDIINETPRTKVASMKFKQGLAKTGKETAKALRDILVDIASETAKKNLFGGP